MPRRVHGRKRIARPCERTGERNRRAATSQHSFHQSRVSQKEAQRTTSIHFTLSGRTLIHRNERRAEGTIAPHAQEHPALGPRWDRIGMSVFMREVDHPFTGLTEQARTQARTHRPRSPGIVTRNATRALQDGSIEKSRGLHKKCVLLTHSAAGVHTKRDF